LREAFGLTAIEALAARRPIVASRVGGLSEILDDRRTALLAAPGDPVELSACLEEVLSDRALAAHLSTNGRAEYEKRFTMGAMTRGWIRVYQSAPRRSR
jgi:glycosyltransferase involved in cell wall biosynthesis